MTKRYIGIDLGTTNSTVSVANLTVRGDIEAQTLNVAQVDKSGSNMDLDETLPSVLYLDESNQAYVGQFAKRMMGVYPKRVIKEAKRHIGEDVSWEINNEAIRPEVVSSYVLKILKAQAEDYYGGEKIDSVVITVPASFTFQQEKATRTSAILSGFDKDKIHTIPEPTAALLDFLNEEKRLDPSARRLKLEEGERKNLMVFDLGGGTCDVSILQVSEIGNGGIDIQELSISQYTELGGIDFDKKVVNELMKRLLKELGMNFKTLQAKYDKKVMLRLWENLLDIAEKAKKSFSTKIENQLRMQQIEYSENKRNFDKLIYREMLSDQLPSELITTISISKAEYDAVIEELLYKEKSKQGRNIEEPILNALTHSKIGEMSIDDINAVFLVGGMTYYQSVQDRVYEIFNRRIKPFKSINPMYAVSRGASIYHHSLDRINFRTSDELNQEAEFGLNISRDVMFTNTVPNNVYIDVVGGDPVALLEKGTKLPFERIIQDKFIVTGPGNSRTVNAMHLELFTASSAKSIHTKKLKSATINFKKPVSVNSKLVLKVECNEEREVSVKAWLEDDETEVIDVNIGSHEFTAEEIESLKAKQENINKI